MIAVEFKKNDTQAIKTLKTSFTVYLHECICTYRPL